MRNLPQILHILVFLRTEDNRQEGQSLGRTIVRENNRQGGQMSEGHLSGRIFVPDDFFQIVAYGVSFGRS